ncbi:FG-GAP repeat domain-containing protein [Actinomadura sp. 21ATH]|uniref:FG-GAP repeat domain-containing protein n=1 Tax=Actinomadura sp. 21ATH TaxID=1735444 RepID=UPI0035BF2C0D
MGQVRRSGCGRARPRDRRTDRSGWAGIGGACALPRPSDFNGDGRDDIAVGAPRASDGKVLGAGVVDVIYGGGHRQVLAQSGTGIAGVPEENDAFGSGLASADFDRDGHADIAVRARGEGRVTLVYGSRNGLAGRSVKVPTGEEDLPQSVSAGDFDCDGGSELVVGLAEEIRVYSGLGSGGLGFERLNTKDDGFPPLGGTVETLVADFTGDGYPDLAASTPWTKPEGELPFNRLAVYEGSPSGLSADPLHENTEVSTTGIAAGDVNGDGHADLVATHVVPAVHESLVPGPHRRDVLHVFPGGTGGVGGPETLAGVPAADSRSAAAASIAMGDADGDGHADVAVSSRELVTVLYGGRRGLTTRGARSFRSDGGYGHDVALVGSSGGRADLGVVAARADGRAALRLFRGEGGRFSSARMTSSALSATPPPAGRPGTRVLFVLP